MIQQTDRSLLDRAHFGTAKLTIITTPDVLTRAHEQAQATGGPC